MALNFLKNYWAETIIGVVLALVFFGILDFLGGFPSFEDTYSTSWNLLLIAMTVLYIAPAAITGFLVKLKGAKGIDVLIVPAFAFLIAGILITIYLLAGSILLSAADWDFLYVMQGEVQIEFMLLDLPMEQFILVNYLQALAGSLQGLFGYVGMGFLGGAIALKLPGLKKMNG